MRPPVRASGRLAALASLALVAALVIGAVAVWLSRAPARPAVLAVGKVHGLAGAGDDLWAAVYGGTEVVRIDARRRRIEERLDVGRRPTNPALGEGSLWVPVLDRRALVAVDLRDGKERLAVPGLFENVLPEPEGVWALAWPGAPDNPAAWRGRSVVRLDPRTGKVLSRSTLGGIGLGLAATAHSVWVGNFSGDAVSRISRTTGQVDAVPVGARSFAVAAWSQTVWVALEGDRVVQLDAATGHRLRTVRIVGSVDYMVSDATGIWVAAYTDRVHAELVHVNGATGVIDGRIAAGGASQGLAVAAGRVWVADYEQGTVSTIARASTGRP